MSNFVKTFLLYFLVVFVGFILDISLGINWEGFIATIALWWSASIIVEDINKQGD